MTQLAQLLDALGREPSEHLSINTLKDGRFTSRIVTVADINTGTLNPARDYWYGTGVLHPRVTTGRGLETDIIGVRELYADLDVKPGGLPTWDVATQVIDLLSMMLGAEPAAVVNSGHGLQPHWALEHTDITDWSDESDTRWSDTIALWRRWQRLVTDVAARYDGHIDSVFDLSRVLRVPGTTNTKSDPVPVTVEWTHGAPTSLERLAETLDEYGITELSHDRKRVGEVIAPPTNWGFNSSTCGYVARMIDGWATDNPDARHPWLISAAVRLACAHRLECITNDDHTHAVAQLANRFRQLLDRGRDRRTEQPAEITNALTFGVHIASTKTEAEARKELGNHVHQSDPSGRRQIIVNGRPLPDITDEIINELHTANEPPVLFIRSGEITAVRTDENGAPLVEIQGTYKLRDRISRVIDTTRANKQGDLTHCPPPIDLVQNILAQPAWPFPPLQAVTELPTLRQDGTLHDQPGYDPHTRLLYIPGDLEIPPIPAAPTDTETKAAVATIRDDLLGDFPFDSDADAANAIGLLLTPLIRPAIRGQIPLALIDATEPGTGKGLLANVCAVIATGRPAAARPLTNNDEEARKMILSTLLSGPTIVVFDNIEAAISSPTLAGVLTTDEWVDRMLGRSEDIRVPNRATWIATGNNLAVGGDIGRRCYRIRLNARCANPDQRTGFTHPDLVEWIQGNRGRLVAALLTIARAWWVADCPPAPQAFALGGFTPWVRIIAGILHHVGIEGFLGNLLEFRQTIDVETQQWETFLAALHDLLGGTPTTAGAIANKLVESGQELKDTVPSGLIDHIDKSVFSRRLGDAFRQREGRRHGLAEWSVINTGTSRLKTALWTIEPLAASPPMFSPDLRARAGSSAGSDPARVSQVIPQTRGHAGSSTANARANSYPQDEGSENTKTQWAETDPASPREPTLTSTSTAGSDPAPTTNPETTTQRNNSLGQQANPGQLGPLDPNLF